MDTELAKSIWDAARAKAEVLQTGIPQAEYLEILHTVAGEISADLGMAWDRSLIDDIE